MVKVLAKDIAPVVTKGLEATPDWVNKFDSIVKGINQMFTNYYQLTGNKPPGASPLQIGATATPTAMPSQGISFSDAREAKKTEMAARQPPAPQPEGVKMDYFKELLTGLVKSANTLKTLGFGEKPVGEVLYELPFTLDQAADFLEKLYQKHFGGK